MKRKEIIYLFATCKLALKCHAKFFCLTTSTKPSDRKISIVFLCIFWKMWTQLLRILANLKKTHFRFQSHFRHQSSHSTSPVSQTRKIESRWSDKQARRANLIDQKSLSLKKVERKSTKTILRFWNKLKLRKDKGKKLAPTTNESLTSA